jgi:pimeloyl-ACP methyl ester carboxylesterase
MKGVKSSGSKAADRSGKKALAALLGAAGAAAGGWIAYSRFGINHEQHMPAAIDAIRREYTSPRAGRISYYEDASASWARPLVLLHSINAAASSYEVRPLFQHFRRTRPVYAIDLPGFGFSERSDREYSPKLYAHAILDVIQNGISANQPVDAVALSLSSEFLAQAAVERPSLFRNLVMIGPSGLGIRPTESSQWLYSTLTVPLWSQPFYDILVTPSSIDFFLRKTFAGPIDRGLADYDHITSHQPGARFAPLHFVAGKLFTPDIFESAYVRVTNPTLVIHGEEEFVKFDRLPELLARNKNWCSERISPSKGMPHFEHPEKTNQLLERFFQTQIAEYERVGEPRQAEQSDWLNPKA